MKAGVVHLLKQLVVADNVENSREVLRLLLSGGAKAGGQAREGEEWGIPGLHGKSGGGFAYLESHNPGGS